MSKEYKEAYDKALKIADMLGISTVTHNKDGSKTTRKPKKANKEVDISDIIEVILE
ncbi:hypothetical protein SH601_05495 [Gracilibacillus sp. S3-1-1]|uniref:Uncharacterized protein n=1 Tax=Gracilibacillus pellucidus TaxID=3095368 RepID=A0ACC6M3D2_9BACI|nr:hypothetical protein [Gracilibacillus sp. S3-1-1]MDX8045439.1 hypothetical protein [Gracilibacillus sp. S3-1-1]